MFLVFHIPTKSIYFCLASLAPNRCDSSVLIYSPLSPSVTIIAQYMPNFHQTTGRGNATPANIINYQITQQRLFKNH